MGPVGGYIIKKFDAMIEEIPAGFEMLVNNFSAGIIGADFGADWLYGRWGPVVLASTAYLRKPE